MSTAAQQWPWQRMNEFNAPAHEALASLLDPAPGERWLDVGTGAGGLAFALARRGADVVGVDISEEGLVHARGQADEEGLAIDLRYGDAQELPIEDAGFDGVASSYGVIFASDQEQAAAELARVCRPGGKLGLALMAMDSRTGSAISAVQRFGGGPSIHPASWSERADDLLGGSFDVDVRTLESPNPPPPPSSWDEAVRSIGYLRELVERLGPEEVAALRAEIEGIDEAFRDRKPTYVVVVGVRR